MDASPLKRVIPRELLLMTLDELSPQLISIDCNMCLIAKCTCRDDTETATEDLYRNLVENIRALSALSRTCKELHELITPLLYRCPLSPTTDGDWLLTRTLLTSPDLAQLVKILVPDHPGTRPPSHKKGPPSEVTAFCLEAVMASPIRPDARGSEGQQLEMENVRAKYNEYSIPVDIITRLCPNLEQLCLLGSTWACLDPRILWGDGTSFPKLKRVSISMYNADEVFEDCEYFPLLRRTPNIESIHIFKCDAEVQWLGKAMRGLNLSKLKIFELGNVYYGEERLNKIPPMMPNIEQLVINHEILSRTDYDEPQPIPLTPMMAADYIVKKRAQTSKLRNFTLNFMLPLDGWSSRCNDGYDWKVPLPEVLLFLQRCRDELDEATQIFAGLGIILVCTIPIPTDADPRRVRDHNTSPIYLG